MTKDAAKVLRRIYEKYLDCLDLGLSRSDAKSFGSIDEICTDMFSDIRIEDLDDRLRELHREGYLVCDYGDDSIYDVELTTKAISELESKTKNQILSIADFISKFIP